MKRIVIILDGPPASGKTTLAKRLTKRIGSYVVNYNAFGPANIIAKMKIIDNTKNVSNPYKLLGKDLFLLVSLTFQSRFMKLIIFMLLEILYKLFQQIKILMIIFFKRVIVIDEFLALRVANYVNALKLGVIDRNIFNLLYRFDICFFNFIQSIAYIKYIGFDPCLPVLLRNWRKRGHKVGYDISYLALVRFVLKILEENINTRLYQGKINFIRIKYC